MAASVRHLGRIGGRLYLGAMLLRGKQVMYQAYNVPASTVGYDFCPL